MLSLESLIRYIGRFLSNRSWTNIGQLQKYISSFPEVKEFPSPEEIENALELLRVSSFLNEVNDPKLGKIWIRCIPEKIIKKIKEGKYNLC